MTSTFTNIIVSGSTVTTNLTCDTLQCNEFEILTTDLSLGGSLGVNSITQDSGNLLVVKAPIIGLNGNVIIGSSVDPYNLTVYGNTTFIDTTNLDIKDALVRLNKGGSNITSINSGIEIEGSGNSVVSFLKTTGSNVSDGWIASQKFYSPIISTDSLSASNVSLNNSTLSNVTINGNINTSNITIKGVNTSLKMGLTPDIAFSNRCTLEMLGNSGVALSYNTMNGSKDFYIRSGNTNTGLFYYDGYGSLTLNDKITTIGNAQFGTSKNNTHTFNGNVLIGTLASSNTSILQFPSVSAKKIALYDTSLNDYQYVGLNATSNELGYNTIDNNSSHKFYNGVTSSSKQLLTTIEEWGLSVTGNIFTNNNVTSGKVSTGLLSSTTGNIGTVNSSIINNSGNINTTNLITTGLISSNISVGNITIGNTLNVPLINSTTINNTGNIIVNNNVTSGTVNTGLLSSTTGNITFINSSIINNSGNINTSNLITTGLTSSNISVGNITIGNILNVPLINSTTINNTGNIIVNKLTANILVADGSTISYDGLNNKIVAYSNAVGKVSNLNFYSNSNIVSEVRDGAIQVETNGISAFQDRGDMKILAGNVTIGSILNTKYNYINSTILSVIQCPDIELRGNTEVIGILTANISSTNSNITNLNTSIINNSGNIYSNNLLTTGLVTGPNYNIGNLIINSSLNTPLTTSTLINSSTINNTGNINSSIINGNIYSSIGNIGVLNSNTLNNSGLLTTGTLSCTGDTTLGTSNVNVATVNGQLKFNNVLTKKMSLFEVANNDFQYYGFNISNLTMGYSVGSTSASHVFYSGATSTSRLECVRIKGLRENPTSTSTGCLQIVGGGGIGCSGDIYCGNLNTTNGNFTALTTGTLNVSGASILNSANISNGLIANTLLVSGNLNSSIINNDLINSSNVIIKNGLQIGSSYNDPTASPFISLIKGGQLIDCANIQGSCYQFSSDRVINGTFTTASLVQINHTTSTTVGFSGTFFLDMVCSVTNTLNQTASRSLQLQMNFVKERGNTICNCAVNSGTSSAIASSSGATITGPTLTFNAISGAVVLQFNQPTISTGTYAYTSYSYHGRVVVNQLSSTVSHIQNLVTYIAAN